MKIYIPTRRKFSEDWYLPKVHSLKIKNKKGGLKIHFKFQATGA